jgi:hypothetical protein
VVVFAGCYGSTEPATDTGPDSATLNARGTANHGPASAYFEYWVSGTSGSTQKTDPDHFPGGAHGRFSKKVTGLAPSTAYSFRLCGSDDAGGPTVCAQTRAFQTPSVPVDDSVTGHFDLGPVAQGTIDAHSGPSGENPHGQIHYRGTFGGWAEFDGDVTCVAVNGRQGAVGAVGRGTPTDDPSNPRPVTLLATVVDGNGTDDTIGGAFAEGSTPPDCATASFTSQVSASPPGSELAVTDLPASTPTRAR